MENMKPVYQYIVSGALVCMDPEVAGAIPPYFCKTQQHAIEYLMNEFETLLCLEDISWKMIAGSGAGTIVYVDKETNEVVATIDPHEGYAQLERPELEECDYERWEYNITKAFMRYEPVQEEEDE